MNITLHINGIDHAIGAHPLTTLLSAVARLTLAGAGAGIATIEKRISKGKA